MNLRDQFGRALCGVGLIFALTVMPASWALSPTGTTPTRPAVTSSKVGPMDVNSATVDQLRTLPGIGDAYARRIVAGRPYSSKNQLVTKGILPRGVYDKIQSRIVATHPKK